MTYLCTSHFTTFVISSGKVVQNSRVIWVLHKHNSVIFLHLSISISKCSFLTAWPLRFNFSIKLGTFLQMNSIDWADNFLCLGPTQQQLKSNSLNSRQAEKIRLICLKVMSKELLKSNVFNVAAFRTILGMYQPV